MDWNVIFVCVCGGGGGICFSSSSSTLCFVVSSARQTLENAISMVDNHAQWGAKVVYGDTDSLFVLLPGKSRADAFSIGR